MTEIRQIAKKYLLLEILAIFYIVSFLVTQFLSFLYIPPLRNAKPRIISIQPGTKFRNIAAQLKENGIISSRIWFIVLAEMKGSVSRIRAGEYDLSPSMLPDEVLDRLISGKLAHHMITIPEGFNLYQIADLLDRQGLVKKDRFLAKAFDSKLLHSYGFDGPSFEGYLFPDTYEFNRFMEPEQIIFRMTTRFKVVYSHGYGEQARKQGLSLREVITLASVIEKETGQASERPLISAVFRNRLSRGIPLQADPTVIYGLKNFSGDLKKKDLETANPYNTYIIKRLPPGPIACPGELSIKAALNPRGRYLYFVSKNDGSHHFSKTLEEHNRAVALYQKALVSSPPDL